MPNEMSKKIHELRKQHKLTLEQVASVVGVGKSTVRKWETGMIANMRRDKIALLAQALHTTPSYLMGWEKSKVGSKINKNISHNIQHVREQLGLTQKQFADKLGVDEKTVAVLESGEESLSQETLYSICDTFQIKPYNIVPFDEDELDENTKYLLSRGDFMNIDLQLFAEPTLTEAEQAFLNAFRRVPEEQRETVLAMVRAVAKKSPSVDEP